MLVLLLLAPASLAQADGTVPDGYDVPARSPLHPGVEHLTLAGADPAQTVQMAHVEPGAPVALKAVSAYDAIPHRTSEQELPSEMCRRVSCIAGVNGDFHDFELDEPYGGVITGGRLLRSPRPGYDQLTVARDGTLHAGQLGWSGWFATSDGTRTALAGVNVERGVDGVVLYTPEWGRATPAGADAEFVLRAAAPVGGLGTSPVQVVGTRRTSGGVPSDGAVLSAAGPAAAALLDLAGRVGGSVSRTAQLELRTAVQAVESLGVNPVILRNGRRAYPDVANGFIRYRSPRTLLGWNASGHIVMVTVDGRRDDARGMTMAEAADLLIGLGATEAVNFDGGGGTTFVVAGEVRNLPSDPSNPGPPAHPEGHVVAPGHVERLAPNGLMIVAKPGGAAPLPSGPSGGTTTPPAPGQGATAPASGSPGKTGGDRSVITGIGRLQPVASVGDLGPWGGASTFVAGGTGRSPRLLPAVPGRERPRTGRGKGQGDDGGPEAVGHLSGDWLPGAVAFPGGGGYQAAALPIGPPEDGGPLLEVGYTLAAMVAGGMILAVLGGIDHVRRSRRVRPALWL